MHTVRVIFVFISSLRLKVYNCLIKTILLSGVTIFPSVIWYNMSYKNCSGLCIVHSLIHWGVKLFPFQHQYVSKTHFPSISDIFNGNQIHYHISITAVKHGIPFVRWVRPLYSVRMALLNVCIFVYRSEWLDVLQLQIMRLSITLYRIIVQLFGVLTSCMPVN